MRFFYVFFNFLFLLPFVGFASQKGEIKQAKKTTKIIFLSSKLPKKIDSIFFENNEQLSNDLAPTCLHKASIGCFMLILVLGLGYHRNQTSKSKVVARQLMGSKEYLFKMLYPKHVFW